MRHAQLVTLGAGYQIPGLKCVVAPSPALAALAQLAFWCCSHLLVAPFLRICFVAKQRLQYCPAWVYRCLVTLTLAQVAVSAALGAETGTIGATERGLGCCQPQSLTDNLAQIKDVMVVDHDRLFQIIDRHLIQGRIADRLDRKEFLFQKQLYVNATWLQASFAGRVQPGSSFARNQDSLACAHQSDRALERINRLEIRVQIADLFVELILTTRARVAL